MAECNGAVVIEGWVARREGGGVVWWERRFDPAGVEGGFKVAVACSHKHGIGHGLTHPI
jgi:hypothetical protein